MLTFEPLLSLTVRGAEVLLIHLHPLVVEACIAFLSVLWQKTTEMALLDWLNVVRFIVCLTHSALHP